MNILAIDVSGNFKEGKGTSGLCWMVDGEPEILEEIKASDYNSAEAYWFAHVKAISVNRPDAVVMEGYRLYNHKKMAASSQANSELETPQLIGVIKLTCHLKGFPLHIQYATEVKSRWSDKVLQAKGILEPGNKFDGKATNNHKRDALRHALHYWRYGKK